jgi:hypothetical protein
MSSTPKSESTPRCDKTFISNNIIDLDIIRSNPNKIKFQDKNIKSNFINYKNSKNKYDKKGMLISKSCSDYLQNRETSTKTRKNCMNYKKQEKDYYQEYTKSLYEEMVVKILRRMKKTLKNPKESRMKKISCYIKLLLEIISKNCNKTVSLHNIVSDFDTNYKSSDHLKKTGAKLYLEYLLINKTIPDNELKLYKKWYENDDTFIKALETVIKSYTNCSSVSRVTQRQNQRYNQRHNQRHNQRQTQRYNPRQTKRYDPRRERGYYN